jgi:FKBP-type peptidyl-prolyl cis-trans isomerase FkpA
MPVALGESSLRRAGVAAFIVLATGLLAACSRPSLPPAAAEDRVATLVATDTVVGQGVAAAPGAKVSVHYSGWLYDHTKPDQKGTEFDSSRKHGSPFEFTLGKGQVIPGWDQGVSGMKVGGQRRLVIPSYLAYGDSGAGGVIPPGATLVFDVELMDVKAP